MQAQIAQERFRRFGRSQVVRFNLEGAQSDGGGDQVVPQ
jgi:hypothetical protein